MNYALREDKQQLVILHLSQLLDYVTGFGGLIVPLILWLVQKDKIYGMDEHGKMVVNFQLSLLLYAIISSVLILIGIGILMLIAIGILGLIIPIINAVRANNGQEPSYPLTIRFIN